VIIEGKPLKVWKYEEVLREQLLIGLLSKGAATVDTTNDLPVNDRRILLTTLQDIETKKHKKLEEIQNAKQGGRSKRF